MDRSLPDPSLAQLLRECWKLRMTAEQVAARARQAEAEYVAASRAIRATLAHVQACHGRPPAHPPLRSAPKQPDPARGGVSQRAG